MAIKNYYWFWGGLITLFTAVLHTVGGGVALVGPLLNSSLDIQTKTELHSVWHLITVLLFATAYVILVNCRKQKAEDTALVIRYISYLFMLFGLVFILVSLYHMTFAPQWILFFPIGLLLILGESKK